MVCEYLVDSRIESNKDGLCNRKTLLSKFLTCRHSPPPLTLSFSHSYPPHSLTSSLVHHSRPHYLNHDSQPSLLPLSLHHGFIFHHPTPSLPHSLTPLFTISNPMSLPHSQSLTHNHSLTHTHSLTLTHTHSHSLTHSLTHQEKELTKKFLKMYANNASRVGVMVKQVITSEYPHARRQIDLFLQKYAGLLIPMLILC